MYHCGKLNNDFQHPQPAHTHPLHVTLQLLLRGCEDHFPVPRRWLPLVWPTGYNTHETLGSKPGLYIYIASLDPATDRWPGQEKMQISRHRMYTSWTNRNPVITPASTVGWESPAETWSWTSSCCINCEKKVYFIIQRILGMSFQYSNC